MFSCQQITIIFVPANVYDRQNRHPRQGGGVSWSDIGRENQIFFVALIEFKRLSRTCDIFDYMACTLGTLR